MEIVILCCFAFLLNFVVFGQTDDKSVEGARETLIGFYDALAKADADGMSVYVSSDYLLIEEGKVWDFEMLKKEVQALEGLEFTRINSIEFLEERKPGENVILVYNNGADIDLGDQRLVYEWLESAVLVWESEEWRILLMHVSGRGE